MMGRKTSPKHVEFYSKNKFEKLVHLVGFVIKIYHAARSSECQIQSDKFESTRGSNVGGMGYTRIYRSVMQLV
jgi:hypothetical protein